MGSQSFCSDPYPPLPSSFKTNSPWLPLTPPLMLLPDAPSSPSVTLGWQSFSEPPRLKLPSAKPGLTTGASSAQRSRYESTPPSGRLVSDPPLHTGRNGFILFPLSRNLSLTNSGARVENDIGAELVQACGRVGKIYSSPKWATSGLFKCFFCCCV